MSYLRSFHTIHLQLFVKNICCCKIVVDLYILYWEFRKTCLILNHLPSKLHKSLTFIVNDHKLSMIIVYMFNTVTLKKHVSLEQSIYPVYIFYLSSSANCLIEWFWYCIYLTIWTECHSKRTIGFSCLLSSMMHLRFYDILTIFI